MVLSFCGTDRFHPRGGSRQRCPLFALSVHRNAAKTRKARHNAKAKSVRCSLVNARSGKAQQAAAKGGSRFLFPLGSRRCWRFCAASIDHDAPGRDRQCRGHTGRVHRRPRPVIDAEPPTRAGNKPDWVPEGAPPCVAWSAEGRGRSTLANYTLSV